MSGFAASWHERVAAISLLTMGLATATWIQSEAVRAAGAARTREQQLEHLRTLSQPAAGRAAEQRSLAALRGLFHDHDVVWLPTASGPVLTVSPRTGERAL